MSQNQDYFEAGKVSEISNGQMKHVEINGKEIVIANLNGKFYAFAERCGHMNARLSRGNVNQNIVTCPFHAALKVAAFTLLFIRICLLIL
jgi:nitrite reductase/ring-hydroxylating ferredoxin subunit